MFRIPRKVSHVWSQKGNHNAAVVEDGERGLPLSGSASHHWKQGGEVYYCEDSELFLATKRRKRTILQLWRMGNMVLNSQVYPSSCSSVCSSIPTQDSQPCLNKEGKDDHTGWYGVSDGLIIISLKQPKINICTY